jgi:DNA helicase-2/ATP-dependent DNA helicase PcrA
MPSRFIDELPEGAVELAQAASDFSRSGYGASRFDRAPAFQNTYNTPGWQRAQAARDKLGWDQGGRSDGLGPGPQPEFSGGGFGAARAAQRGGQGRAGPRLIEGEVLARSTGAPALFQSGARVFHIKFGPGTVASVDGNKLTVDFDKAGRKMVLDSFVQAA